MGGLRRTTSTQIQLGFGKRIPSRAAPLARKREAMAVSMGDRRARSRRRVDPRYETPQRQALLATRLARSNPCCGRQAQSRHPQVRAPRCSRCQLHRDAGMPEHPTCRNGNLPPERDRRQCNLQSRVLDAACRPPNNQSRQLDTPCSCLTKTAAARRFRPTTAAPGSQSSCRRGRKPSTISTR